MEAFGIPPRPWLRLAQNVELEDHSCFIFVYTLPSDDNDAVTTTHVALIFVRHNDGAMWHVHRTTQASYPWTNQYWDNGPAA
jgi:hypothetical protein